MVKKLSYSELPGWPRLLSLELAASYVGVSEHLFKKNLGTRWPHPLRDGNRILWDKHELDRMIDGTQAEHQRTINLEDIRERIHNDAKKRKAS
tara:strand:+ start:1367 stop:1645 length:279 start_codon:yes stop_codon:yes gene_type:complete